MPTHPETSRPETQPPRRLRYSCLTDQRNAEEIDRLLRELDARSAPFAGPDTDPDVNDADGDDADGGADSEGEWIPAPETYDRHDRQQDAAREAMAAAIGVPVVSEQSALATS